MNLHTMIRGNEIVSEVLRLLGSLRYNTRKNNSSELLEL
jgi:hypothetical protein